MDDVDILRQNQGKKALLAVFAKQPLPGQVKTRLCPPLSMAEAAAVYEQSLTEIVSRIESLRHCFDLAICYAGARDWFAETFPGLQLVAQQGADLGQRMEHALRGFFAVGYERAVLIGSDTPDLPLSLLEQTLELLDEVEVVYGPARDGGYYLIGESHHYPQLFSEIPWSTAAVLQESLKRARAVGIFTARLPVLEDLDDLAALRSLLKRSPASRTALYLQRELSRHFG